MRSLINAEKLLKGWAVEWAFKNCLQNEQRSER